MYLQLLVWSHFLKTLISWAFVILNMMVPQYLCQWYIKTFSCFPLSSCLFSCKICKYLFLIPDLITGLCCTVKNIFNSLVACVTSLAVNLEFSLGRRRRWPVAGFCWFVCCCFHFCECWICQCPWQHFHKTDYSICVAKKKSCFLHVLNSSWLLTVLF